MGCSFSRANGCYSPTCCCCLEVDEACSWIAIVGLVWGGVATLVDFISANLPRQRCVGCLDHDLNVQLSVAAGCINLVQWVASVLLLIGAKLDNRWLLLPWLAWGMVSLAMQGVWLALTLPGTPSVRAAASLFQLAWGVHFFIVVKTQYTKLALTFIEADRPPPDVPPNTPVRKHKRRWRRLHPACQPPIRTLLGVGLRLQRALDHAKKVKMLSEDESEQEEEEEREHEEEIRVTVESHGSFAARGEEETCSRRRSGWRANGERTEGGRGEQDVWEVIVHTSNRDVRGRVELKRHAEDENHEDKPEMQHCDDEDEEMDEKEKKTENESKEEEESERKEEEEASEKKEKDEKLTKKKTEEKEELPKEDDMEDSNKIKTNENQEGDGSEAECQVVIEGTAESGPILYRASKPSMPH